MIMNTVYGCLPKNSLKRTEWERRRTKGRDHIWGLSRVNEGPTEVGSKIRNNFCLEKTRHFIRILHLSRF